MDASSGGRKDHPISKTKRRTTDVPHRACNPQHQIGTLGNIVATFSGQGYTKDRHTVYNPMHWAPMLGADRTVRIASLKDLLPEYGRTESLKMAKTLADIVRGRVPHILTAEWQETDDRLTEQV